MAQLKMVTAKEDVEKFWDKNPLGGSWTSLRLEMKWRYEREPWITGLIKNGDFRNKNALEVGCGPGLDTALMAGKVGGGHVAAVDLSLESLRQAKRGLGELGLLNKVTLQHGDAEDLPFRDAQFDIVYSYGVLHHTPNTQRAIDEIYRVLKPGGKAIVMLYRKHTPQQIMISGLRKASRVMGGKEAMFTTAHDIFRINKDSRNPEHGTSLSELFKCPVLQTFSKREARAMFGKFEHISMECYQTGLTRIPEYIKGTTRFRKRLFWLDKELQKLLGFYMVVSAQKKVFKLGSSNLGYLGEADIRQADGVSWRPAQ
jgi:ubiquinone/menaquinone biosynthesis C-methylase UbiE